MTTQELTAAIPLDRTRFNCDRLVWEVSTGAGYSYDLDTKVVHERLLAISSALLEAANWIARENGIAVK